MADDYFAAMQRVEQRLEIAPPDLEESIEVVNVQVFQLIQRLELPKLCFEERLGIATQLREALGRVNEVVKKALGKLLENSMLVNAEHPKSIGEWVGEVCK